MTDWTALEKEMGGNYKIYAADGTYTVKCDSVEIKEVGENGSIIMKFHFEDSPENAFPTADHWLSFKNANWRKWHNRCLMMALGASKENAEKAVDVCESKGDKANIVKAYEGTYGKLLAKKPTVDIEVYTEGKYARAEFTDRSVAMPRGDKKEKKIVNDTTPMDDMLAGAEEVDLSNEELPF